MKGYAEQAATLRAYYARCLARSGPGPGGVDWYSAARQQVRFAVVSEVITPTGPPVPAVLDVGCGFGDLLSYLAATGREVAYTGLDLSAPHLAEARRRHPAADFLEGDALDLLREAWHDGRTWDYVMASGTLNVRVPRWEQWSWALVEAMWRVTRHGLAFNMLSNTMSHPPAVVAIDAAAWLARCRTLSATATLRADYLAGDVTFVLPRPAPP